MRLNGKQKESDGMTENKDTRPYSVLMLSTNAQYSVISFHGSFVMAPIANNTPDRESTPLPALPEQHGMYESV